MTSFTEKVADMMRLRSPAVVDEGKLIEQRERGEAAERLLRDEALQDAFKRLDETYQHIWRNTAPDDYEVRERAWTSLKILDDVRNHLITTVRDGAVARQIIEKTLRL